MPGRVASARPMGSALAECRAGVGRPATRAGYCARLWDIKLSPRYDLTSRHQREIIKRDGRMDKIIAAILAVPCTSWGRIRGLSKVLRNSAFPWGIAPLDQFTEKEQASLKEGNLTMIACIELVLFFQARGIPWVVENPEGSFCWYCQEWQRIFDMMGVFSAVVDYCALGLPWRKRTRFVFGNCGFQDVLNLREFRCRGKGGICSFSNCRHVHLQGHDRCTGLRLTQLGEPYPRRLCDLIRDILLGGDRNKRCSV